MIIMIIIWLIKLSYGFGKQSRYMNLNLFLLECLKFSKFLGLSRASLVLGRMLIRGSSVFDRA